MNRRVVVHSFHSQVPRTLTKLEEEPDVIIALDAHIDTYMPTKELVELMPNDIELAATRASAHTMIRYNIGGFPALMRAQGLPADLTTTMYLVVPQASLDTHVSNFYLDFQSAIMAGGLVPHGFQQSEQDFRQFLSNILGIQLYVSPPKSLLKVRKLLGDAQSVLFDLDVDYLQELQSECYTPLKGAQPGQLGSIDQTFRIIRKVKPFLITVSEAKVQAIQDPKSHFSRLMARLKAMGYAIRHSHIFKSDTEAEQLLRVYEDYYKNVQKPIHDRWFKERNLSDPTSYEGLADEIKEATKRHFERA